MTERRQENTPPDSVQSLSHVEGAGPGMRSRMVDVGDKQVTSRTARARAVVVFPPGLLAGILAQGGPKGPITEVARTAGVLAAKRTGDLIPMCHPLALHWVQISFQQLDETRLEVSCETACSGRTGVEMESMVGASIAALTVYDMTKALSKGIHMESVELLEKTGGKSGTWQRPGADSDLG